MHKESFDLMKYFTEKYLDKNQDLEILDVGSYDVNGNFKKLFENPNWNYVGLDMVEGPNVDIISKDEYDFGIEKEFDVVISGNCLEHVEAPWKWIKQIEKVTKKNGIVCIITPFSIGEHRFPVDCWRILPDGYKYLLEKESDFELIESKVNILNPKYVYFDKESRFHWVLKILPRKIKKILEYTPTQDTYAIARKK
jgi:SAM-dependent methyltransferase